MEGTSEKVNKPVDSDFQQQRLKGWAPIMTPLWVITVLIVVGVSFIPTGIILNNKSFGIYENTVVYDGSSMDVDCSINNQNQNRTCSARINITEDVEGPLFVYYKLTTYYQNHRIYVASRDFYQLSGEDIAKSDLERSCSSKVEENGLILNPCGLIANSLFTDIFTLDSSNSKPSSVTLDENDITWESDEDRFAQPEGFEAVPIPNSSVPCANYVQSPCNITFYKDQWYAYYYPNDDSTQYLYESYPQQINPVVGVNDEHFQVWMRAAALPTFRKLYGKIDADLKKGDYLTFMINANYEVDSFDGTKSLTISQVGEFGGKNNFLGVAYIIVGSISLLFATLLSLKQAIAPRPIADLSSLHWDY